MVDDDEPCEAAVTTFCTADRMRTFAAELHASLALEWNDFGFELFGLRCHQC
jgi:hypothetical protein